MPDKSIPPYEEILELLLSYHGSPIGASYYYIQDEKECRSLCRIIPGTEKIFFHEVVDHEKHGISEEDMNEAVRRDGGAFSVPGYYPISPHIETKLRVLLEGPGAPRKTE